MLPINFNKDTALRFLDCLINGKRIEPGGAQPDWSVDDMLQLAGACFFALALNGPEWAQTTWWGTESGQHTEHVDAEIEAMMHDLHAAIHFTAQLTQLADWGTYDREYEPRVRCGIKAIDTNVEASVVPVEGFKGR